MAPVSLIEMNSIYKSYQSIGFQTEVLKNITLHIDEGDYISIMGPSGAGKSTLMAIAGCLSQPTSGEYILDGEEVGKLNDRKLSRIRNEKIGFVFQFHHLLSEFTALENVLMPAWIGNFNSEKKDEAIDLFAELNLSSKMDYYPNQLSGGERSRVALLRGIINKPKILLADEPTGNLDEKNASVLIELLKKINTKFNQSIIITTHNPNVAMS